MNKRQLGVCVLGGLAVVATIRYCNEAEERKMLAALPEGYQTPATFTPEGAQRLFEAFPCDYNQKRAVEPGYKPADFGSPQASLKVVFDNACSQYRENLAAKIGSAQISPVELNTLPDDWQESTKNVITLIKAYVSTGANEDSLPAKARELYARQVASDLVFHPQFPEFSTTYSNWRQHPWELEEAIGAATKYGWTSDPAVYNDLLVRANGRVAALDVCAQDQPSLPRAEGCSRHASKIRAAVDVMKEEVEKQRLKRK